MAMAATLEEAAYLSFDQCAIAFNADTLPEALEQFCVAAAPIFPDASPDSRTVGNWLIPIQALSTLINTVEPYSVEPLSPEILGQVAFLLYRMCFGAEVAVAITGAQQAALLTAWNDAFGT